MAYAQINYPNTPQGIPPTKYTLAQVGCFITSFCNLQERFGRGLDPPALNAIFRDRGLYIDVDDGVRDDVAWDTITKFDPNTVVVTTGVGNPPDNNCIVKFIYNGSNTHFCLVNDVGAGTIIDSWDGKVKSWNVYGGVKAWASYNNKEQAEEMIQDSDNEYNRWNKAATQIRGRHQGFTRDEFRAAAVGRTWLQALEILSDDPEADSYYSDSMLDHDNLVNLMGELGIANSVNDNDIEYHLHVLGGRWKPSFYDLIKRPDRIKIPDLQTTITKLQGQLKNTEQITPLAQPTPVTPPIPSAPKLSWLEALIKFFTKK